ncbi:MAG: exo-alpha-sialidase, partial [Gammaproteobacteria bacterium]|nr:exo-alpha-sialidase [Gammaproteobacteria bacterium]
MTASAKIIHESVIYHDPHHFCGWPSLCRRRNGELIALFSGDRHYHVCPFGKTVIIRSNDEGASWSQPEIINHTPFDDRDPGLIETPEGALLLFFFSSIAFAERFANIKPWLEASERQRWQAIINRITPAQKARYLGSFVRRSEDGGRSWGALIPIPLSAPHGGTVCDDGVIRYLGKGVVSGEAVIACCESSDDGRSWQLTGTVANRHAIEGINLDEPHLLQLNDGSLLGMMRSNSREEQRMVLYQSHSSDNGHHW